MTRIAIDTAGHRLIAEPHPAAPRTVAAFLNLLPYRQQFIHVRWSGEACWVPLGNWRLSLDGQPIGFENATSHPSAGDIQFSPGGHSETEIIMAYGACAFSSKLGQLAGNHFLTVTEGREHLRDVGERSLWRGVQAVVLTRLD